MFIGHYAVAFAAKTTTRSVPLWHLIVATQLVDFVWSVLILAGIEKASIEPGFMAASDLNLYHMPYTHGLLATVLWTVISGLLYGLLIARSHKIAAGLLIGAAVGSHWVLDLIVHGPDLPLISGPPKFGLGLWDYLWPSQLLETGLLVVAVIAYWRATAPRGRVGRVAPLAMLSVLLASQLANLLPMVQPDRIELFALMALAIYTLHAAAAAVVDRVRTVRDADHRAGEGASASA
ncbi:membrane protein, putative [Parvularcula bermudensis HTCC2503]|uniref:Membrane protein, putative n=1 Tax=Parvularcula bermudensis (strain ATCC BAA-594 / HTCC2503 / KCTC 12087) TaxID=314260 RepID=E0TGL3_PARBH|nr:hypothetical protein [Parvularcula bermudensis]ADM10145.1 membrane protein, putative [Parvularcula bermudensis HTCC2503]